MVSAKTWFMATRPFSFGASVMPVLVGTLLAAPDNFRWWAAVLAVAGSVFIHAGTNLVNDYFDHVKGADGPSSLGPAGFIQRGVVSAKSVLVVGLACFAAGSVIGLVLCATTDWSLIWLGVASVLAGFLYTGAPIHLAYIALGEVTVFIFMGPIMVLGAYFVQVERWDWEPVVASLPIAFLVTAILQANNLRDIDTDRTTGKRTIATIIGRERANWEMYGLLAGGFIALIVAAATQALPWPGLIALGALPLVRPVVKVVREGGNPRKLNMALIGSVQLHKRFGSLMIAGLAFWWALESVR